jgi:hypothetical protein
MKIMLRWRDDGVSNFKHEKQLGIDILKQHEIIEIYQTGIYKTRQYELVMTDSEQSIGIAAIEEEVQVLR